METSWKPHGNPRNTLVLALFWHCLALFGLRTRTPLCSHTPRFSYRCPKTAVLSVAWPGSMVRRDGCTGGVWGPGGYREGIPGGLYRVPSPETKRRQ